MAALNKLRNDGVHIALPYKISPVLSESQLALDAKFPYCRLSEVVI